MPSHNKTFGQNGQTSHWQELDEIIEIVHTTVAVEFPTTDGFLQANAEIMTDGIHGTVCGRVLRYRDDKKFDVDIVVGHDEIDYLYKYGGLNKDAPRVYTMYETTKTVLDDILGCTLLPGTQIYRSQNRFAATGMAMADGKVIGVNQFIDHEHALKLIDASMAKPTKGGKRRSPAPRGRPRSRCHKGVKHG